MWKEYTALGGPSSSVSEKKSDLLQVLPEGLRHELLWRASDLGSYIQFRDMIDLQAAKTFLSRRKLPIHALGEGSAPTQDQGPPWSTEIVVYDQAHFDERSQEQFAVIRQGKACGKSWRGGRASDRTEGRRQGQRRAPELCQLRRHAS